MKATEQTIQQIERAIRKVADKFPTNEESGILTDIHLRVNQDTGELVAFDDDDKEITRCIIEQWIDNKDDDFYKDVAGVLRSVLSRQKDMIEKMAILKPYSFVLEDEDHEHLSELYLVDDETVIIDHELMEGLDKDLDSLHGEPSQRLDSNSINSLRGTSVLHQKRQDYLPLLLVYQESQEAAHLPSFRQKLSL